MSEVYGSGLMCSDFVATVSPDCIIEVTETQRPNEQTVLTVRSCSLQETRIANRMFSMWGLDNNEQHIFFLHSMELESNLCSRELSSFRRVPQTG